MVGILRTKVKIWNKCFIFSRQKYQIVSLIIITAVLVPLYYYTGTYLIEQSKMITVVEQNVRIKQNVPNKDLLFNNAEKPVSDPLLHWLQRKAIQEERKAHIEEACSTLTQKRPYRGEITGYKDGGISYCIVQKAGCTSWLRVFRFLNGEKEIKKTPLDISKYETHNMRMKYFKFFNPKRDQEFIENSVRVMTVRDPYSRLWSAYIDKFLLPDFWKTKGREILRRVRKNATTDQLRCGSDVTFKEFIAYVVLTNGTVFSWGQDKHWIPASSMCDPCQWKPKYIAKQETLSKDMKFILKSLDLDWALNGTTNIDRTEFELRDQTNYVFNIYNRHSKCATKLQFCELMWQAYKLNGYIPFDAPFPKDKLKDPDKETFLRLLNEARRNWQATKDEIHKIKRKALVDAFKTVPYDHLRKLQDIYEKDFFLFDYEIEPEDIFI